MTTSPGSTTSRRRPYTVGEAAAHLREKGYRVSPRTIARYCDAGEITSYRTAGGDRRIPAAALHRFVVTRASQLLPPLC